MSYDEFASDDAWEEHLGANEVPIMDDDEALEIFRQTPFLHQGAKR